MAEPATPAASRAAPVVVPAASTAEPAWPGAVAETPDAPLVGREAELEALRRLAFDGEPRFITLVGVGGVGKSRLAVELVRRELAARGGRIAFVPLDGVSDPSLVLPAIAGAVGVADEPGAPLVEALSETLGRAPAVLVLDTVEHLRPAAPSVANLAVRTPGLTIIATSRIALGVPRETVVWVEPLPVIAEGESDPAALARNPATALFLERARAVRPELEATPAIAAMVSEICRRLDGIPLAIELAAASLRVLAPHQLLDQLGARLAEAPSGPSGPERQRSMRAAMDWSVGLLAEPELRLHRRVAVIAGSFSSEVAASILERGERRGLAPLGIDVGDGLRELVAASLLRSSTERGEPVFVILTTVRADALERLRRSGELVAMRWAHAYEVLALAEQAELDFPTRREVDALDRLESAHDDIREALDWAMDAGDGAFAVRLTGALTEFFRTRGYHTEGRLRLAAALALGADAPAAYRRKALSGAGVLASFQGDFALGDAYLREALAVARSEGDDEATAVALNALGTNAYGAGDLDAAEAYISESLAIRRQLGEPAGIATALNALGGVYHFRGELDRARELFTESLALKQHLGSPNAIAVSLTNLGLVERDAGRPEAAADAFAEAIAIWERTGDRQRGAVGIHNAALLDLDLGRYDAAATLLDRAYDIARELGDRIEMAYARADRVRVDVERGALDGAAEALAEALPRAHSLGARVIVPLALEGAGGLAAVQARDELAVRLWAAAAAERAASGYANMPADERLLDRRLAEVRGRLDPGAFAAAWAAGWELPIADAVTAAMSLTDRGEVVG